MPAEHHPQIRCPHRTTPSDTIIVDRHADQEIRNRKSDRNTYGPKWQAYDEREDDGTRVDQLCNKHIPAATLTGEQPGGNIAKRDAKRRNGEPSKDNSRLLPLWSQQDKSHWAG